MRSTTVRILLGLSIASVGPLAAQTPVVTINPTAPLTNSSYGASAIGWYFTPTTSFFLTAINTRFNGQVIGANQSRTVTAELWSDRPANGGGLLRSGAFDSDTALDQFGGGSFASFLMQAGVQYFIGFRNVSGLGRNSSDLVSTQSTGWLYYSVGDPAQATYGTLQNVSMTYNPSLELLGYPTTVTPEPMTVVLMATGLAGVGGVAFIRRRRGARSA